MENSWEEEMIEILRKNDERIGISSQNTFEDNILFRRVSSEVPKVFLGTYLKAECVTTRRSNKVGPPSPWFCTLILKKNCYFLHP